MMNLLLTGRTYFFLRLWICIIILVCVSQTFAFDLSKLEIAKVELLTVSSSVRAAESFFGHASLLMVPKGKDWTDGFVVSFYANTTGHNDKDLNYYSKGLTGAFPFSVVMQSASSFFYAKLIGEGLDIERTVIPLSHSQAGSLWSTTLSFQAHPEQMGRYYFIQNNCSSMILYLMKRAGIQMNYDQIFARTKASGVQPKQMVMLLRDVLITPFPTIKMKSIKTRISELASKYEIKLGSNFSKESNSYAPWSLEQIRKLQLMTKEELVIAAQSVAFVDSSRNKFLQAEIKARKEYVDVQFIDFQNQPESMYQLCSDSDCITRLVSELKAYYSAVTLKEIYNLNQQTFNRTEQLLIPELNLQTSPNALQWSMLVEALKKQIFIKKPKP